MDLTDVYRACHSNTKEHTFFPAPHRIFCKIYHTHGDKASLNRYKNIEITFVTYRSPWIKAGPQQETAYNMMEIAQLNIQ